ncbi:hypothetical protein OG21DRAFT_1427768 [Imleria badia]|nr:hypothetical protein OG21DRAFT_1427768 [Imleria badia]
MVASLTKQESCTRYINKLIKHIEGKTNLDLRPLAERPCRVRSLPSDHYYVSTQSRTVYNLSVWLQEHARDCAIKDFHVRLKDHILACLRGIQYLGEDLVFSHDDRDTLIIAEEKIHKHKVLQVNYTTYDLRHKQDSITATHPDIMVLSQETDRVRHPYISCQCSILW